MLVEIPIAAYLRTRAGGDPALDAGIAALVAGQPGAAAQALDPAGAGAGGPGADAGGWDPARRLRAAAYRRLTAHLRWNTFPGGGGAGGTEIAARWDIGAPGEAEDGAGAAEEIRDPAVVAEARLVGGVVCALRSLRLIVSHASIRLEPAEVDRQLEEALATVAPLRGSDDAGLRGYAHLAAADLAWRAGRGERAVALLADAAAAYGNDGDRAGLGACHLLRGDWRAAPAGHPETRNLTLIASAAESSALDWTLEAVEASCDGLDPEGAAAAYSEADAAFAAEGDTRGLAAVALRRGHLAALAGDHPAALSDTERSAEAFDAAGDSAGACLARVHGALVAIGAGRLTARTATAEHVGRWGAGPGSFSYALGLGLLCSRSGRDWLLRRADAERALAAHRLATALFAALGAVTDQAQGLVDAGRVRQVLGDEDGAGAAYEEALDLLTTDLAARPEVVADNRLRAVVLAQNLYSLQLARRNATGMTRAAERLGDQVSALPVGASKDSVEAALRAAAEGDLAQATVLVPLYRAEQAREAGDVAAAEEGFAAALHAARAMPADDRDFLQAVVLGRWRRDEEAAAVFRDYLHRQSERPAGLLGRVLARLGPMKAEVQLARQHLHEQAGAFFFRVRDYQAAARHFDALEHAGGPTWWSRLDRPWEPLSDHGAVREALGELARAQALHAEAIAQLESRGPRSRHDERTTARTGSSAAAGVYLAAARTALRRSEAASEPEAGALAAQAFTDAERGRARGLVDGLRVGVALARVPAESDAAVRAWHQANAEVELRHGLLAVELSSAHADPGRAAALREAIAVSEAELARREAELEAADPAFAAAVAVPAAADLDEVRVRLPARAALLAYHHVGDDLLGFAVTADGLVATTHQTIDDIGLRRNVAAFTSACAGDGNGQRPGQDLSVRLLDPFRDVVAEADRLIVVPPVAAHTMPFHALPWDGRPLAARHAVSYLPIASALRFLPDQAGDRVGEPAGEVAGGRRIREAPGGRRIREAPGDPASGQQRALAVGNPARMVAQDRPGQPGGPAPPLPGAAIEAAFVAALFGDACLLVGEAATEPAVREVIGTSKVVHLATHGQLSAQAPLLACLLLADGQALSVFELMALHLDADLLVASACDTGAGRATAGGDAVGLIRGLLAAGARGAVVSLWPVPDRTTCVLMAEFYRRLRGGAPAPVALQRAQMSVRMLNGDGEAAAFDAIAHAVDDPASSDLLSPLPAERDPVSAGAGGTGGGASGRAGGPDSSVERSPYWWAGFIYVGR